MPEPARRIFITGGASGIGAATALLGRRDRLQPEDPDAPLFI